MLPEEPYRCPICGHQVDFVALEAVIRGVRLRQVTAGRFRPLGGVPEAEEIRTVLVLICESCGHPARPPQEVQAMVLGGRRGSRVGRAGR